jgi:peptidoglycan hydrolase-like protein with peptidoglycan-binding domain
MRRTWVVGLIAVLAGCATSSHASARRSTATSTSAPATSAAVLRAIRQPEAVTLPALPSGGIGTGSRGPVVLAYQHRLRELHFDPGPVEGLYSQDTAYAVVAVEKLLGLARDGIIGPQVQAGLEHFTYKVAVSDAERDRVEINLDTQVLTVYQQWQPVLITTTSTGSGAYFCGGNDGCQYAITPTGHFHFQYPHAGWDTGKLGRMWNPYYFDGGIAVHGLPSVPSYPASHGCARIPMDIANYFPTLVTKGESIYVNGTPMKPGSLYVGPATTTTATTTTTTTIGSSVTTTTSHPTPTTTPHTTTSTHATTTVP